MTTDEKYMMRCIDLAQQALGNTYPNPMVGCVVVHKDEIIGEGFHKKSGEPHAEVNAINSVKDHKLLKESTLYVSLEPCSHYGKTPPCSDLIISKKIPKVVIGSIDPFAKVAGKGIERLKNAGIDVEVGIHEQDCKELNKRFFTFHLKKRPYIILKWAQTRDGFIDIIRNKNEFGQPTWITNEMARQLVHKTRSEEASILVGTKTVLKDNPSLTVRNWQGKNPTRIVLDRNLSIPKSMNAFDTSAKTLVFNALIDDVEKNITYIKVDFHKNLPQQIMDKLYSIEVQSLIVEGGAYTLQSFIDIGLWDEAHIYTGSVVFGEGINAPIFNFSPVSTQYIGESFLSVYKNNTSLKMLITI